MTKQYRTTYVAIDAGQPAVHAKALEVALNQHVAEGWTIDSYQAVCDHWIIVSTKDK